MTVESGDERPVGRTFLSAAWGALGGPALPEGVLRVSRHTGLYGPLAVPELALGAVAAQLLAASTLCGRDPGPVHLDAAHVGLSFRSERYARKAGAPIGQGFAPLSRFLRTADGWLRLHGNYPHHRAAALRVLGDGDPAQAAARWSAEDLEAAVVEAGGAAAAVRTAQRWRQHPQGAAVAMLPLLSLRRVGDAPPREIEPRKLRVLDLTRVIAGPVAGRTLASHGADVLRLDSPRLPEDAGSLLETGPGKRHAVVDFATAAGRASVEELLREADILLQGYRPGALDAFGLDPASLAERHPHLAVVHLRAWGPTGPWQQRRGFDSIVQAATGIADLLATADGPGALPAQALDHGTGHLTAAAALRAVTRRRDEGGTWHAELSLAQTAQWLVDAGAGTRPDTGGPDDADVDRYLVRFPSPTGAVTLVSPPGSPVWSSGPVPGGHDRPEWLSRG